MQLRAHVIHGVGGSGRDFLNGGAGIDYYVGGAGADVFHFPNAAEAFGDGILDFEQGLDKIGIDTYTPNTFFIGPSPFFGIGNFELRAFNDGVNTYIEADVNGDGLADTIAGLEGVYNIVADDFILFFV